MLRLKCSNKGDDCKRNPLVTWLFRWEHIHIYIHIYMWKVMWKVAQPPKINIYKNTIDAETGAP